MTNADRVRDLVELDLANGDIEGAAWRIADHVRCHGEWIVLLSRVPQHDTGALVSALTTRGCVAWVDGDWLSVEPGERMAADRGLKVLAGEHEAVTW